MNIALRKPWTQDRFFAWAEAQDVGYEFEIPVAELYEDSVFPDRDEGPV
jgi:hypothetical protein